MKNSNTEEAIPNEPTSKFQEQTPIAILIEDLETTSNLMEYDLEKKLVLSIIKILKDNYLDKEREIMSRFAFDFYFDLSDDLDVPENLISENLTHAEIYFDQKFNRNTNV